MTHLCTEIAREAGAVLHLAGMNHAVATNKTFRSLARICGAPSAEGPRARRSIQHAVLTERLPDLLARSIDELAALPGSRPAGHIR